jgi:hypothetical protein
MYPRHYFLQFLARHILLSKGRRIHRT